jgi:hypothetical protein
MRETVLQHKCVYGHMPFPRDQGPEAGADQSARVLRYRGDMAATSWSGPEADHRASKPSGGSGWLPEPLPD